MVQEQPDKDMQEVLPIQPTVMQLEVVAPDLQAFGAFTRDVLQTLPGVKEIQSNFSLKAVKSARTLPIPG